MKLAVQQRLYDALKRINEYRSPEYIRKHSGKEWGLDDGNEAIEMAYENVLNEARVALRGVRRPSAKTGEMRD
jgi:hypothetical protein